LKIVLNKAYVVDFILIYCYFKLVFDDDEENKIMDFVDSENKILVVSSKGYAEFIFPHNKKNFNLNYFKGYECEAFKTILN
jgi:hypothetical protein